MRQIPTFDFKSIIDKHLNSPFRRNRDWEVFYADIANDIYDTYEFLSEVQEDLYNLPINEKSNISSFINIIEPQLNQFMDLMFDAGFESHYYDRFWHQLCGMQDDISKIKTIIT